MNATLSWTAPTQNTDGTPITGPVTYNLYQFLGKNIDNPPKNPVLSDIVGTEATIENLIPGTTQCFFVCAVVNGQVSAPSNTACRKVL